MFQFFGVELFQRCLLYVSVLKIKLSLKLSFSLSLSVIEMDLEPEYIFPFNLLEI